MVFTCLNLKFLTFKKIFIDFDILLRTLQYNIHIFQNNCVPSSIYSHFKEVFLKSNSESSNGTILC